MEIEFKDLVKNYGKTEVVKSVNLSVRSGEFTVLVGPSGCGKSTTLRMVAGLEEITGGEITFDKKVINQVEPDKRSVAMVFQDYALYPHMSVYENISFGLKMKKQPKDLIEKKVKEAAEMLDLNDYLDRKPAALSGGQRQRVAMGRAVVKEAGVFLFDEPLSNLDAKLRSKMRLEIKKFHQQTKKTVIYVTHDQLEAMTLADKLVVMSDGHIEQVGTPLSIYQNPKTLFVASFIGTPGMNLFNGRLERSGDRFNFTQENNLFSFPLPKDKSFSSHLNKKVVLGIRPSDIFVTTSEDKIPEGWKTTKAEVELIELLGKNAFLTLKLNELEFTGEIMGNHEISEVSLSFNLHHAHIFDKESGVNLNFNSN